MKISRYILSGLFTILALFFCSCEEETSDSFEAVKKANSVKVRSTSQHLFAYMMALRTEYCPE